MKRIILAALLATGLSSAPFGSANASITLTAAELIAVVLGSTTVGVHLKEHFHGVHMQHKAKYHSHSLTPSQVRAIQAYLNSNGCNAGPVDGILGPKTKAAIKACF